MPVIMSSPVKCTWPRCSKVLKSAESLNRHIEKVHKKEYVCPVEYCEATFNQSYKLKRHNIVAHLKERKYICSVKDCDARFYFADKLKRHEKLVHSGERNFKCRHCTSAFSTSYIRDRHETSIHSEEKNFKCGHCASAFTSFFSRQRHENYFHAALDKSTDSGGIRPSFLCAECGLCYTRKDVLARHIQIKHGNFEHYECDHCGRKFDHKNNLKKHIFSRHGSKYFQVPEKKSNLHCIVCKQSCQLESDLLHHYVNVHGIDLNVKTLSFSSTQEFYNWKKEIEDETITRYVFKDRSKNHRRIVYACHRSGNYTMKSSNRKRAVYNRGSKKLNGVCPASIKLILNENEQDPSCTAIFTQAHVGHSTHDKEELKYIFLRKEERDELAKLVASGIPKRQIRDQLNESDTISRDAAEANLTRINLITKKDLYNIEACYKAKGDETFVPPPKEPRQVRKGVDKNKRKRVPKALKKAHELALEKREISIEMTDDGAGWLVPSFQAPKDDCVEMYMVRKIRDTCPAEEGNDTRACNSFCTECGECGHKYSCTCSENSTRSLMCKHIHAMLLRLRENSEAIDQQLPLGEAVELPSIQINMEIDNSWSEAVEPIPDENFAVEENEYLSEEQKFELMQKFLSVATKISTVSEQEIALRYLDHLETVLAESK